MKPRIMGTEMEWGLLVQYASQKDFVSMPDLGPVIDKNRNGPGDLNRIGDFLSNGSRFYPDVGHLEYATPEDSSIEGTVANEIAGERVVLQSLEEAKDRGRVKNYVLNKRLIDDEGNTWGHHENFSGKVGNIKIDAGTLSILGLHMVTVNIFTGAGAVIMDANGNGKYVIAQKVFGLEDDFGTGNTSNKPVVSLRTEHHADNEKWVRVHATGGDANISPWAMRMRLGSTSLVLSLIEHGMVPDIAVQPAQHKVGRQVARDLTLRNTVELTSGKKFRPVDIQEVIINAVKNLAEEVELTPEELSILAEWERALADLKEDPLRLRDRADWVAKKVVLDAFKERHRLGWSTKAVRDVDKLWGNMGPEGIGVKLRSTIWAPWMPSEELISQRMVSAPETTRATLRGRYINSFPHLFSNMAVVNWSNITHNGRDFKLKDPYATTDPDLEQVLEAA